MNREQYEELTKPPRVAGPIRAIDFIGAEHTLLYGYTCNRETWHVYWKGDLIHVLVHDHAGKVLEHAKAAEWTPSALVPDKRVYPESTDPAFARMLRVSSMSPTRERSMKNDTSE